jgi:hypothetical protein
MRHPRITVRGLMLVVAASGLGFALICLAPRAAIVVAFVSPLVAIAITVEHWELTTTDRSIASIGPGIAFWVAVQLFFIAIFLGWFLAPF